MYLFYLYFEISPLSIKMIHCLEWHCNHNFQNFDILPLFNSSMLVLNLLCFVLNHLKFKLCSVKKEKIEYTYTLINNTLKNTYKLKSIVLYLFFFS